MTHKPSYKDLENRIRELEHSESLNRKSHEKFLTVLDGIDATIYVADMKTYEILFMNKHMIDSFGRDMTGDLCFRSFRKEAAPCGLCTNDRLTDEKGLPSGVHVWQDKNPITDKFYINYDRAIEWTDGRLVRLQVATEITNQKKAEAALIESEKRYRNGMDIRLTFSAGISNSLEFVEDISVEKLIRKADERLYLAKEQCRNTIIDTGPEPGPN